MSSQDGDGSAALNVLGVLLAVASLIGSLYGCYACCKKATGSGDGNDSRTSKRDSEDTLRAPLVSLAEQNRAEVSFRHATEGHNKCAFCGFENLKRFLFCRLCTSALARINSKSTSTNSTPDDKYEQLYIKESQRPLQTLNVRQRQVRAKLRKEWLRKVGVNGDLFWYRDDLGGFNTSVTRFPGYTLKFESHHAQDIAAPTGSSSVTKTGSSKVVIETPLSKEQVIENLSFEVVFAEIQLTESSLANPAHIPVEDGHYGSLQWHQVLELADQGFLTKYACFATAATGSLVPAQEQLLRFTISRGTLLEGSMESLAVIPRGSIRAALHVSFIGDIDQGNSTASDPAARRYQEWFTFLTHQLAEPDFGVFRAITNTEQTFYLNPNSLHDIGEQHLMYYFATGRLVGRALLEGQVLGFHLALPLLKIMLGLPVSFNDLEYVDPEGYKRLLALLVDEGAGETDGDEGDGDDTNALYFCVEETFGKDDGDDKDNDDDDESKEKTKHIVDLIPDGRNVRVTDLNKDEYLNRVFRYQIYESVSSQLYCFLKGLYEVFPQELLMLFDPEEFDYLLCGSDEINVVAWKRKRKLNREGSDSIDAEDVIEAAGFALDITSMILDL